MKKGSSAYTCKHSPASSEGSSTTKLPYAPVTFPSKWYQHSQDPYDGYEDCDLNLDWWSSDKFTIDKHARQIDKSNSQSSVANKFSIKRICTVY